MNGSVLEEKSSFKMLGLTFSSKLDWGSYIISIAKTASKKFRVLICSMKFLSPEVDLFLYKSTIAHAWNTVVMYGLVALVGTWDYYLSCKYKYAGLLAFHLLPVMNPWLIVEM